VISFDVSSEFVDKDDGVEIAVSRAGLDGSLLVGVPCVSNGRVCVLRLLPFLMMFPLSFCGFSLGTFGAWVPIGHRKIVGDAVSETKSPHVYDGFGVKVAKESVPKIDVLIRGKGEEFIDMLWVVRVEVEEVVTPQFGSKQFSSFGDEFAFDTFDLCVRVEMTAELLNGENIHCGLGGVVNVGDRDVVFAKFVAEKHIPDMGRDDRMGSVSGTEPLVAWLHIDQYGVIAGNVGCRS